MAVATICSPGFIDISRRRLPEVDGPVAPAPGELEQELGVTGSRRMPSVLPVLSVGGRDDGPLQQRRPTRPRARGQFGRRARDGVLYASYNPYNKFTEFECLNQNPAIARHEIGRSDLLLWGTRAAFIDVLVEVPILDRP